MTSTEDQHQLVSFAKHLKWEEYIKDAIVCDSLIKIRNHVQQKEKGSSTSSEKTSSAEVDLATAKRVKLVVVGDGAIGKTSLLIRFATGEFPNEYVPTVFENYTAQMKRDNGEVILLHLWDTAGQEDYDRLRPLSYPGADVVLLCFSTISQASYEAVRDKWAPEVHHFIPTVPTILVGTKIDLREEKHPDPNSGKFEPITPEQGQSMAKQLGCIKYMEVSSKTGRGVNEVYNDSVNLAFHTREGGKRSDSVVSPSGGKEKKKKGGCILM
jgi:Ras-related C3 botulinum toxin substrate 1